jgi:hypothetical protein
MNCEVVQRQLLSVESPDSPTAVAAAHLADCPACREWLLRLVQMERAVPCLPVPPAEAARSALMRRLLSQKAGAAPSAGPRRRRSVAMVLGSWIMDPYSSPRRRVAAGLIAGVAAALLLFVLGWLVWYGGVDQEVASPPRPMPDSLVADLGRYKIHTADGKAGGARVEAMAAAAQQLHARCQDAARNHDYEELTALATLYVRVVDDGVVKTAETLSPEDRRSIPTSIAEDLGKADTQWNQLSQQTGLPERAIKALKLAALAARNGNARLGELSA